MKWLMFEDRNINGKIWAHYLCAITCEATEEGQFKETLLVDSITWFKLEEENEPPQCQICKNYFGVLKCDIFNCSSYLHLFCADTNLCFVNFRTDNILPKINCLKHT